MDTEELKNKLKEYPVPVVALAVAAAAFGAWHLRADAVLEAESELKKSEVAADVVEHNKRHGVKIEGDLAALKKSYAKISQVALNFDNRLESLGFFSDLIRDASVKTGEIPDAAGVPVSLSVKPFAVGTYIVRAEGVIPDLVGYMRKLENASSKSLHVDSLKIALNQDKTSYMAEFGLKAWGYRGKIEPIIEPAKPGKIENHLTRLNRINAINASLSFQMPEYRGGHLLGLAKFGDAASAGSGGASGAVSGSPSDQALELALATISIERAAMLAGKPTVLIRGIRRREGNTVEIPLGGSIVTLTVESITTDGVGLRYGAQVYKRPFTK